MAWPAFEPALRNRCAVSCCAWEAVTRLTMTFLLMAMLAVAPEPSTVTANSKEISLSNGLIRRVWRIAPNAATVALDNLQTGASVVRAVKPEAELVVDGERIPVGGLRGQPDGAYLKPEWLESMTSDPSALSFKGFRRVPVQPSIAWKRVRHASPA